MYSLTSVGLAHAKLLAYWLRGTFFSILDSSIRPDAFREPIFLLPGGHIVPPALEKEHLWRSKSSVSMIETEHSIKHGTMPSNVCKYTGDNVVN